MVKFKTVGSKASDKKHELPHPARRKKEIFPDYLGYILEMNGRRLTSSQREHFLNCVQQIHRTNQVIYRGDKKSQLLPLYGLEGEFSSESLSNVLFMLGAKGRMFAAKDGLPGMDKNEIDISASEGNEFALIFRMLHNLMTKEFPFGGIRVAMKKFRDNEALLTSYFRNEQNVEGFVRGCMSVDNDRHRIMLRDYYLVLLHHISKSQYYTHSFLLSTSVSYPAAQQFGWAKEDRSLQDALIICGWIPRRYYGILSAPDYKVIEQDLNLKSSGLPVYDSSMFPKQEEITLKGGLFPHYIIGYVHYRFIYTIFEVNPAIFKVDDKWNGRELPIDQSSFIDMLLQTTYGRHFSIDEFNRFSQHSKPKP